MEYDHNVIARTPIDINLAKQLNILITEMGFDPDKIIIDPNMGALGYGLDYAYSVIERIKLAALEGDNMLNMPIIAFVGEEAWKTKEAKSENVQSEWGDHKSRAVIWECITASSVLSAGANIVVMNHHTAIEHIKNFIDKA
jgi:acetyl-CoA decarbonylase/synthase complex subunit delta